MCLLRYSFLLIFVVLHSSDYGRCWRLQLAEASVRGRCIGTVLFIIAKFHYTGPTGPDRTRTDFFAARVSDKVRAGPCSGI